MNFLKDLWVLFLANYGKFVVDASFYLVTLILGTWAVLAAVNKFTGWEEALAKHPKLVKKIKAGAPVLFSMIYYAVKHGSTTDVFFNLFAGFAFGAVASTVYDLGGHKITDFIKAGLAKAISLVTVKKDTEKKDG